MATNDTAITVEVLAEAPAVTPAGFGTPMIAGPCAMSERIRFYATVAAATTDQLAGDITAAQLAHVAAAFDQSPSPDLVAVGRIEADVAQVNTVTVGGTIANGLVYTITINGVPFAYTAVVPTDDNAAVATQLRSLINAGSQPVTASGASTAVILTADVAGTPFTVTTSTTGAGTLTNVATTANVSVATELAAILASNASWYGLGLVSRDDLDNERAGAWIQSANRIFAAQTSSADAANGVADNILEVLQDSSYSRTFPQWYSDDNEPCAFAWLAKKLAADLDVRQTAWAHAALAGIPVDDENLTDTQRTNILGYNGNVYLTMGSAGSTFPGKMSSGQFIDVTTTVDWYAARVREALIQLLQDASNVNSKVPFNDLGFTTIGATVENVNGLAVRALHLNEGTTFVNLPLLSELSNSDRTTRNYPFTFGGQLTSAVLTINATGYVSTDGVAIAALAAA